ncbi:GTPase HflX, partial [Herbaspirillum sp. HC18]
MEPRNFDGDADRPRSAGAKTGRVLVIGPYLRVRAGSGDAQSETHVQRDAEARL